MSTNRDGHIRLTSHPGQRTPGRYPIAWGAASARERGPVIGTVTSANERNAIGAHGGSYALYRALAVSSGALNPLARPDLSNTAPVGLHRPLPAMGGAQPHRLARSLGPPRGRGFRPGDRRRPRHPPDHRHHQSAANHSGVRDRSNGGSRPTAKSCSRPGEIAVTKAAIDPVWYLPGIAERFDVERGQTAPHAVRADRRQLSGAGDASRPHRVPAADRRHHALHFRRSGGRCRSQAHAHLPRARRMQRLRRVWLGHLHLPPLSHPRHRRMREGRAKRRRRRSSSTTARKAGRSAK